MSGETIRHACDRGWTKVGAGILATGVVLQGVAWFVFTDSRESFFWIATIAIWELVSMLLALWTRFFSGLPRRVRIAGSAAAILIIGGVLQVFLFARFADDPSSLVMYGYMVWPTVLLLLVLWFAFLSGLRWRVRLTGVAVVALVALGFRLIIRVEDFRGDMIPRFRFVWVPSKEDVAIAYWKSQRGAKPAVRTASRPDAGRAANGDSPAPNSDGEWPGFRGPNRDGVVRGIRLVRDWSSHPPRELWKHPVGLGWSSFAVVGGLAYTQEQRTNEEVVACYDVESGAQVWVHADSVRFHNVEGGDGPQATPTVFDGRLYSLGATGILNCLDSGTGDLIWTRNILTDADAGNISWGMAGSPLVYDDVVVVNPGGKDGKAVVAYDRKTGEIVWSAGNDPAGYTAPRLDTLGGTRQVLVFGGTAITGYDAVNGTQLWTFPWENQPRVNAAQPIVINDESVFIGSGYGWGSARLRVTKRDGNWHVDQPVWVNPKFRLKFNAAVRKDDFVYGLDEGILTCVNLSTGKRVWKRGRYGYGQILLVDDLLLVLAESGDVVLVEATPQEGSEIARFQAIEGKTWGHPVIYRDRLLVRNAGEAGCFELSVEATGDVGYQ